MVSSFLPVANACAATRKRVDLLIALREEEDRVRRSFLLLERSHTEDTLLACQVADDSACDAMSRMVQGKTSVTHLSQLSAWVLTWRGMPFAESELLRHGLEPSMAPLRLIKLIDGYYCDRLSIRCDSDVQRVERAIRDTVGHDTWEKMLTSCEVAAMFGRSGPLQNMRGRAHFVAACMFSIRCNGGAGDKYCRLLPPLICEEVLRIADEVCLYRSLTGD